MIAGILSALGSTLAFAAGRLFTRKVLVKIAIIGIDHLVSKSKQTWDDELWKPLKKELEKEII